MPETLRLEQLMLLSDGLLKLSEVYLEALVPLVREALDGPGLQGVLASLGEMAEAKDKELERLTQDSTDDILAAIEGISLVKANSDSIRDQILEVSDRLRQTGEILVERKKSLVQCRQVNQRLEDTTATLDRCLRVLEMTNSVLELIREKRYYNALRHLEDLSNEHLAAVSEFSFAAKISQSIPALQQMILHEAQEGVTRWMARLEKSLPAVGEALFAVNREVNQHWLSVCAASPSLADYMVNTPVELAMRPATLRFDLFASDNDLDSFNLNPHSPINATTELSLPSLSLTAVYDALLVYGALNRTEDFAADFHTQWANREERVARPLTPDTTITFTFPELEGYVHKIAAFFAADKGVIKHTRGQLRTEKEAADQWGGFMALLTPSLHQFIDSLNTMNEYHQARDLLGSFCQVMETAGYNVVGSGLYLCLVRVFERYTQALNTIFEFTFNSNMDEDDCTPMVIQDPALYAQVVAVCWYHPSEAEQHKPFPRALPFSNILPLYCQQIQTYVLDSTRFISSYYTHEAGHLWQVLLTNIEHIMDRVICQKYRLRLTSTTREEIAQNLINLEFFLHSAKELVAYLSEIRVGGRVRDAHLGAIERFVETKKMAEDSLFGSVDKRIEDFMGIVEYDWFCTVKAEQPNFIINDIGRFIEDMFNQTFSNLPTSVKTLLLFRTFDLLATHFLGFLDEAERFTPVAIENFDLDVTLLENTINDLDEEAPQRQQKPAGSLSSTFTELRQTINLLRDGSPDTYNDPVIRQGSYDRVKPNRALVLLGKIDFVSDSDDEPFMPEGSASPRGMNSLKSSSRLASLWRKNTTGSVR